MPRPTLATAAWTVAGVSPNDQRDLILRTRPEENRAVIITPSSHVADALLKIQELSISQRTYPLSAYLATPDDSCKGVVPGLEPGTPSHMLVEEMQASGIQILQARMTGPSNIALVTSDPTYATLRPISWGRAPLLRTPSPPAGLQNVPQIGTPSRPLLHTRRHHLRAVQHRKSRPITPTLSPVQIMWRGPSYN
ncbi:hypothetical protein HPB49_007946 [Dermacentor silvarum]|uniref:Uncharacterized protein n=1 Tax=Dermacentor silvarum TaxID=543639 RepID=A0ACB8C2M7_DERSI|nr:hypothetical protein HPB49_007946 [Dermacentor silvarum]